MNGQTMATARRWCAVTVVVLVMTVPLGLSVTAAPPRIGKPIGVASGAPPANSVKPAGVAGGMPPPQKKPVGRKTKPPTPRVAASTKTFGPAQILSEPTNSANEYYGTPVTVSKDNAIAVVSATEAGKPGTVYVYTRNLVTGLWTIPPVALPTPGDVGNDFQFGTSTAINNDPNNRTILVGTRGGNGNVGAPGAAYAFLLSGGVWTQQHEFNPTNSPTNDAFGWSVALSADGNTALIGAPETNYTDALSVTTVHQGVAYAYTRAGAIWTQQQRFTDSTPPGVGAPIGDSFGYSVSLSDDGNTALIGADTKGPSANTHGDAFVYTRSGTTYGNEQLLEPAGLTPADGLGESVSISGDGKTALVGAYQHPNFGVGSAYIFINTGTWGAPQELDETVNTGYDLYGYRVALSGDGLTAVVGAAFFGDPTVIPNTNYAQGAVWVYVLSGGTYVAEGQQPILAADGAYFDEFGVAVAAPQTGTSFITGASTKTIGTDANQGQVYYYTLGPDLTPVPGALPGGTVGTPYSQQFTGANGAGAPYTYALASGTLPPGLTLAPNGGATAGTLSGTPTTAGPYAFSITVTDKAGGTNTQAYTLAIAAAATTTTAAPATTAFAAGAQNVTLTATVALTPTSALLVNEGTVTFTVRNASAVVIGTATTSATVVNGAASVSYTLPAGTPAGSYTITAVYNAGADFITSSGTNTLTIAALATTTTVSAATAPFAVSPQNVTLTAQVASSLPVNEGTVTFTVRNASAVVIGTPTSSGTVTAGAASVSYALPAGTAVGSYTITAVYTPGVDFLTSSGTNTLTVTSVAAATTTTVQNASAFVAPTAQNVTLTASVSSTSAVNEGTVTFTVRNASAVIIGSPVTSGTVANGTATATFVLPANTPAGMYTITAVYTPGVDFLTSSGTGTLTVSTATVTAVAVSVSGGGAASVKVGQSIAFKAVATLSNGQTVDVSDMATWSIVGPSGIATIDGHGVARGQSPSTGGPVTVQALYSGKSGTAQLTVSPPTPIVIQP